MSCFEKRWLEWNERGPGETCFVSLNLNHGHKAEEFAMRFVPKVTERDIEIVEMEFGETEESQIAFATILANDIEDNDPGLRGFMIRCVDLHKDEKWLGFLIRMLVKTRRIIEFAYSRAHAPEGAILPVVDPEVGAPLQREVLIGKTKFVQEKVDEVFHDNFLLVKCITAEIGWWAMFFVAEQDESDFDKAMYLARQILEYCIMFYCMIESQLEANHLKEQFS